MRVRAFVLTALLALASVASFAVPGLPRGSAEASTSVECGDIITRSVTLDRDLLCDGDGLIIGANNITLDLGGHRIRFAWDQASAVGIRNDGFNNVTIQNGEVDEGFFATGPAVLINRAVNIRVIGVSAWAWIDGIRVEDSRRIVIEDGNFSGDTPGVNIVNSHQVLVRNSTAFGGNHDAIRVTGNNNTIANNTAWCCYSGVWVSGNRNFVSGNTLQGSESSGLVVASGKGNVLQHNTVSRSAPFGDPDGGGIKVLASTESTVIEDNLAFDNRAHGISVLTHDALIRNNTANSNRGWGIVAEVGVSDGGGNTATGNLLGQCLNVVCSEE